MSGFVKDGEWPSRPRNVEFRVTSHNCQPAIDVVVTGHKVAILGATADGGDRLFINREKLRQLGIYVEDHL